MTPERFQEVSRIYQAAAELVAAERPQYLVAACAGDEALRAEVEALLRYDNASAFLDQPALELATQILAEDQSPSLTGRQVGHCQLRSLLGRGGMGEVWLAEDTQLGRKVAVKLLPAAYTRDAERVGRFVQEARAASSLNHPNIITIHEIGQQDNTHYIVTEYVEGETLRTQLKNAPQKRLAPAAAVEVVMQLATALAAAHEAGIIHRDIKPENVMVRRDGIVKVLDFGLAKLTEQQASTEAIEDAPTQARVKTQSGVVLGTVSYMSPEQARGLAVDARSDLFSFGAVLYEMVAGHAPFQGPTVTDILLAVIDKEPPPLTDVPVELERIISKALRKERAERYQSSQALLADLKAWQQRQVGSGARLATRPLPVSQPRGKARLAILGSLLMLLLAVAAVVYFSFFRNSAIDSLAVLPFVNVGANPNAEYLSDGVTDGLINKLAQLPKLKVMSRSAVFRYKGKEMDAQQAGKALGVRAVLTGKVTSHGDDLDISVELVDARDNSHLWGEQYSYKLSNLLPVQTDLARDVLQQLRLRLSGAEQQRLTKRGTENPEAYELYLKGRSKFYDLTQEGAQKSVAYFQQAIVKDQSYALAYAGLAEAYALAGYLNPTPLIPPKEAGVKAKDAALMAVKLDDTLAEAHTALGLVAMLQEWDWKTAEREFQRAIALNPNYVPALHWYSHYFIYLGRFDESLAESQRALALDPLDVAINFHLGFHYYNARQYDQAIAALQKTLEMNQNYNLAHHVLGAVYEQQGRYQEAIVEMQKSRDLSSGDHMGGLGHVYAISGQRGEAEKLLAQLLEETKHKYVSPFIIARLYEGLGEKEQAFAWLEKAYTERDSNLANLKADPRSDRLRSDPRFADLLRRIGLTQ